MFEIGINMVMTTKSVAFSSNVVHKQTYHHCNVYYGQQRACATTGLGLDALNTALLELAGPPSLASGMFCMPSSAIL